MINGSDIKVLDAISDIESDVVERYKHDKDFEPFLKLFTKEMETLEGAVTLNMTKGFCDRIGLDFNELLSAMREKIRQYDVR